MLFFIIIIIIIIIIISISIIIVIIIIIIIISDINLVNEIFYHGETLSRPHSLHAVNSYTC